VEDMVRALVGALFAAKAQYVIIGGVAASIQGEPRTTRDVDVVVLVKSRGLSVLLRALADAGFRVVPTRTYARLMTGSACKLSYSGKFSVDLRVASFRLDYSAVETRQEVTIFGERIYICAPEELIVYKLARFSPLDVQDMRAILRTHKGNLNRERITELAKALSDEAGDADIAERWKEVQKAVKKPRRT
jgi:hypothetical protein